MSWFCLICLSTIPISQNEFRLSQITKHNFYSFLNISIIFREIKTDAKISYEMDNFDDWDEEDPDDDLDI